MSCSVFIGAFAGRRARYAFMSRLNSYVRMSGALLLGAFMMFTVVAPSAWIAVIAAWYCALLLLMIPIRLPCSAVVERPAR